MFKKLIFCEYMYKSLCEKLMHAVQSDTAIRDDKKIVLISKIAELSTLLYDDEITQKASEGQQLSMLEDFETKHPLITFVLIVFRTMSRLGM